jgi:hypothetical protein
MICKQVVIVNLRYYTNICLEGQEITITETSIATGYMQTKQRELYGNEDRIMSIICILLCYAVAI